MQPMKLYVGDVVQLAPTTGNPMFAFCMMTVTEQKDFGAQGYVQMTGEDGKPGGLAYYRPKWDDMEFVGTATFVACDPDENMRPSPPEFLIQKLSEICQAAYVGLGANYDLPLRFLDILSNPTEATQEQIDALLPVEAPPWNMLLASVRQFVDNIGTHNEEDAAHELKAALAVYDKATA